MLYQSERLKGEVLKWVNLFKVKNKEYTGGTDQFKKKLKVLTKKLSETDLEFNVESIMKILETYFK